MKKVILFLTIATCIITTHPANPMYFPGIDEERAGELIDTAASNASEVNSNLSDPSASVSASTLVDQFTEVSSPPVASSAPSGPGLLDYLFRGPGMYAGAQTQEVVRPIADHTIRVVESASGAVNGTVNNALPRIEQHVNGVVTNATTNLNEAVANAVGQLNGAVEIAGEQIEQRVNGIVTSGVQQLNGAVGNATQQLNVIVDNTLPQVEERVNGIVTNGVQQLNDAVGNATQQLNVIVDNTLPQVEERVNGIVNNGVQQLNGVVDHTAEQTLIVLDRVERFIQNCTILGLSFAIGTAGTLIVYKNAPKIEKLKSKETAYTVVGSSMIIAAFVIVYKGLVTAPIVEVA